MPWPHRSSRLAGGAAPRSGKRTERIGFSLGKLPFIWIDRNDSEITIGIIYWENNKDNTRGNNRDNNSANNGIKIGSNNIRTSNAMITG